MPHITFRHRILAAGCGAIHRRGFSASGLAEVAAAAGVPKGSFYNLFESKEEMGFPWEGAFAFPSSADVGTLIKRACMWQQGSRRTHEPAWKEGYGRSPPIGPHIN